MNTSDNILSIEYILNTANIETVLIGIANRVKERRLELNLTQHALAKRSGVTLPSYRRFEKTGEISLKSLLKIAFTLDSVDEFQNLFTKKQFQNLDELIAVKKIQTKKRGSKNE